jgi:hypothetical protein
MATSDTRGIARHACPRCGLPFDSDAQQLQHVIWECTGPTPATAPAAPAAVPATSPAVPAPLPRGVRAAAIAAEMPSSDGLLRHCQLCGSGPYTLAPLARHIERFHGEALGGAN